MNVMMEIIEGNDCNKHMKKGGMVELQNHFGFLISHKVAIVFK